jgi:hypothetical protein
MEKYNQNSNTGNNLTEINSLVLIIDENNEKIYHKPIKR